MQNRTIKEEEWETSVARAEAATVVLRLLLPQILKPKAYREIYQLAAAEGQNIGLQSIAEEIAWLFPESEEAAEYMWTRS